MVSNQCVKLRLLLSTKIEANKINFKVKYDDVSSEQMLLWSYDIDHKCKKVRWECAIE